MKKNLIQKFLAVIAITLTLTATKLLTGTELRLELVDVPNLSLENENKPQPTVFVGTPFQLKVVVVNGGGGKLSIDGLNKLKVLGKTQTNDKSIINGAVSVEQSIILDVVADQEGPLTVGPVHDEGNSAVGKSNTVQVRVINQPQDSSKIKTASGENLKDQQAGQEVVCELLTDKRSVFQGEPFIVTLKIIIKGQIAQIGFEQKMNFPGFSSKDFGQQQNHQELRDNKLVDIIEKKYVLVSMQSGNKVINPVNVVYQAPVKTKRKSRGLFGDEFFAGFFDQVQYQQKQSRSNGLKIDIKSLPATKEPVDGIGAFKKFAISVDKTSALVNEAITLTLEIDGSGNFDQIATPKLAIPDFIKNYESKNDFIPDDAMGAFGGKKKFEYIIQVSTSGAITIPAQKFVYFDTNSKTYQTLKTDEITLSIKQPVGERAQQPMLPIDQHFGQQEPQQKKPVQISSDIGFIEEDFKLNKSNNLRIQFWIYLILLLVPIFIVFIPYKKLIDVLRGSRIFKVFSKKAALSKFQSEFDVLKAKNEAEKIYGLFLNLLATKFDTSTQLITIDFIEQKLLHSGWDWKKISEFTDYLNECASLHFISTKQLVDESKLSSLFKQGQYWIMLLINQEA
jgi:hypothetical protein